MRVLPYQPRDVVHRVRQGETVEGIAYEHGVADWQAVWQHERNAALRRERPDPFQLEEGDELWIPELAPAAFQRDVNARHVFKAYRREARKVEKVEPLPLDPPLDLFDELPQEDVVDDAFRLDELPFPEPVREEPPPPEELPLLDLFGLDEDTTAEPTYESPFTSPLGPEPT